MADIILWVISVILVLVGIAGVILPALPGTPFVFLGFLLAAYIEDFTKIGWITLTILGVLTLLSVLVDFIVPSYGAKRVGASRKAISGAGIGSVIGIFFGIPGLILGPFVGAFLGEYASRKDLIQAGKAGAGTWLGILIGIAMKVALVFAMIGIFILAYFL